MTNSLRGEFTVPIAAERIAFDTTLGTIARIEEGCGGRAILQVLNDVVVGRRADDQIALLTAALAAAGRPDPAGQAARATALEAEAFLLAFMGALGFTLTPRAAADPEPPDPLAGSSAGAAGAPSRSAA